MTRLRHIAIWVLLVAFAGGGVVGPVAHRIQHGAERLAATDEPCHSLAVHHADVPLWTGERTEVDIPECDLCARRLLVVFPVLAPPSSPKEEGTTRIQVLSHIAPIHVVADRSIRGPPPVSGVGLT